MSLNFHNAVNLSHLCIQRVVSPGDTVIDATCGNGHDTLFLARLVTSGKVLAFDKSLQAISNTARRLEENRMSHRVRLIQEDFRNLALYVTTPIAAIMFNLGYLPGSSRKTATSPEASSQAIQNAVSLLRTGGVMTIVCYLGHPGGVEETEEVLAITEILDQKEFEVLKVNFINQANNPPVLVVVQKLGGRRL